ncbi:hypothetical protein ACFFV7_50895 [Nonomuraea spiralis]|uniref:Uncharacterized protein n=1 Tax=Nonomuraea spiralis TaxID=46182 RepID=A0ABV5IYC5_9ACTN|nr:hypothetical protein [Nonomuraea spiralis]GGS88596.1 hypothetical protein GCM10010176_035470 [Nonomuraea spiralis]
MESIPKTGWQSVKELQRDVATAQGSTARRPALIEASAGWIFTDRTTPPTPPAGKTHIYSQGGRLWATSTAGAVPLLFPPQGSPVPDADTIDAPILSNGATVVGSDYNTLRGDVVDLRSDLMDLISSLRGGDVIDT